MTKMINQYTTAGTIDAAADWFLIDPAGSGVYKKISRNTTLGLSSAPVGLTDSQSITNKILDNTNSLTVKDGSLTIQNTSSTTKQAVFSAASITAGQTRTFTFPDASGTLATIAGTQTLTNKTITSPAITGGTIDNAAITVDSIAGHTSSTIVTVAGLQISSGVLNTANAVTATSVADGAIQPKALTAGTGSGWAWTSYTPTYANLTLGNGTVTSHYTQVGKTVVFRYLLVFGTTTTMSTGPTVSLPVTASSVYTSNSIPVGSAFADDFGVAGYMLLPTIRATTAATIELLVASGTYLASGAITSTTPFTWGTGDKLEFTITYEAA